MQYMEEWKCLHRYSQQGWEALNALIKAYFFRRTSRGGLAKNAEKKTKLLGIARWLQRRMMWYSGHGDALFYNTPANSEDAKDSDSNSNSLYDHADSTAPDDDDDDIDNTSVDDYYNYDSESDDDNSVNTTLS